MTFTAKQLSFACHVRDPALMARYARLRAHLERKCRLGFVDARKRLKQLDAAKRRANGGEPEPGRA